MEKADSTYDDNEMQYISGPDLFGLEFDNIGYDGYIDRSPVEKRLIESFKYNPDYTNEEKPYKAHWMISESKLYLGYVNGFINGKRLYTMDIFPEVGEDILHFFHYFSGDLIFYPETFHIGELKELKYQGAPLILKIENGILIQYTFII